MTTPEARRWLIIPVEIQVRELPGRLLTGSVAASRGYDVLIGHDRVVRRLARHLPRGILFDKALGMKGDKKIARYRRLGYTITALDEESTGIMSNPDYFLSVRLSPESLSRAERWFAISDKVRDLVHDERPGSGDKIVTTGLPRTDVWRKPFHALYEREVEAIRREHGRFILFCSNFGAIVHARDASFVKQQYQRHQKHYSDAVIYRENLAKQLRVNLDAFLQMLPKLRDWFPDRKVIVRQHPSEDRGYWQQALGGLDGVEIHGSGIAGPWILASDCMVHHGCTTGIEAELMGKPHIMYAPHPDHHHDTPVMQAFAPIEKDEASLRQAIGKMLENPDIFRKDRSRLETYYASLDGKLVGEKVVDEFDKLVIASGGSLGWLKPLQFTPRHLVARYWPRSADARAYSKQKWQGIDLPEVKRSVAIMEKAGNLDHRIEASEVFPQLFHLRRA